MMPRAFVNQPLKPGVTLTLAGPEGHHFARVLRVRVGEQVALVVTGQGYLARVEAVDGKCGEVICRVQAAIPSHEPRVQVYILQGLAKGDKLDFVLQHGTETGAAGFCVFASARSVGKLQPNKALSRQTRWERITLEAASQSQRDRIPSVHYADDWQQACQWVYSLHPQRVICLDEQASAVSLAEALQNLPAPKTDCEPCSTTFIGPVVVLAVGPEGGWDDQERQKFVEQLTAVSVTLGPRILRTESAGLVALAAVMYHFGELGGADV
ncbi:16S rRNA (uracil(1498)-N(3))-methyltransferase [Alicyclobacillaceae bacterium I2511]|nr:16S rRNA (uracil(1498)-N(3))-methyltransferase [Alicyclobacillaceae bacterium I2511]